MSYLVVVTYDETEQAQKTLKTLKALQDEDRIFLEDAVLIEKQEDGKLKVKETQEFTTKRGAVTGGALGFVLGIILGGPIGGLLVGGLLGGLVGKKVDTGISKGKIEAISEAMKNSSSSLIIEGNAEKGSVALLKSALEQSGGAIIEIDAADLPPVDLDDNISGYAARS